MTLTELLQILKVNHGLTQEQFDLLVGTMLGDGNLQTFTKGTTWRYRA
jgi:hypothetical protein